MAITRLGVSTPSANTDTLMHTAVRAAVESIIITNKNTSSVTVSVWIVPDGEELNSSNWAYIASNVVIESGNSMETFRFPAQIGDEIYIRSNSADVSFSLNALYETNGTSNITVQSAAPSSPQIGDVWYDTDDDLIYLWSGTAWNAPTWDIDLYQIQDVTLTSTTNKNILVYNSSSQIWENYNPQTLIQEVDGAGSGIDADLLDGQQSTYYLDTSATAQTKAGDLTITGNLTVSGTTTTINSTSVSVDDKNIELGAVDSPTDTTADGGGITLKGTTDKTISWSAATASWDISENINLASGKGLAIGGSAVLSSTQYAGNAATVTNGVYTTESYADPSWITSISWDKISDSAETIKTSLGLENVENVAISTWPGTTSITNLGTITYGVWNGSVISETYIDGALARLDSPTFSGTVVMPTTTSIGNVSDTEISYLDGVTSSIQTQIDSKLSSTTASSTYAPLDSPVITTAATLPAATTIGSTSATEISYLIGVTSAIQTQIDGKASLSGPTFTGTVSGITATMVGLGNVDNTSDADKPVSTAQQTAIDAKLNLSGGTLTGFLTLDADPTSALHATTKQYVDNAISGIDWHQSVNLFSDSNVSLTGTTSTLSIDGHSALTSSDNGLYRILLTNQTTDSENGIYLYTDDGSNYTLTRTSDADSYEELIGSAMFILEGTTYGGTSWIQTNHYLTDFTGQTWTQFSGSGTITAGTNISITGLQVSTVGNPTFSGLITASSGVAFSDGTQTKVGVPSLTGFTEKTASYTLDDVDLKDNVIEMNSASATTVTIPTDSSLSWPVGGSIDIIQTNSGEVTIVGDTGVTVNSTPGLKLRTQWSSCTLLKRSPNTWIVYGDLKA